MLRADELLTPFFSPSLFPFCYVATENTDEQLPLQPSVRERWCRASTLVFFGAVAAVLGLMVSRPRCFPLLVRAPG